ncbi:MAG: TOTE conflict system archaeo-eukaryotic primase domain-containing protein [Burkholderiaceae bacterium]
MRWGAQDDLLTPPAVATQMQPGLDASSPAQSKIALFRSLFRGREDVHARRFESPKTGQTGYAPACGNEWVRGICRKPQVKCADCTQRRFLPLTDEVIYGHLSGHEIAGKLRAPIADSEATARPMARKLWPLVRPLVVGIYPLLEDETCFFLAVDFDKSGWQEDAAAFVHACRRLHLPAALERSRSGHGGHVWLFFDAALPASMARRLGSHLLTEAMEGRPDIGLDSYDRLFPSQDTMPRGGFGNLIALPLQKGPRELGNSVFLDDDFQPWADQWAFLAGVGKVTRAQVEAIVRDAEQRGRILGVRLPLQDEGEDEPWTLTASRRSKEPPIMGELPSTLELVLADQIYIAKQGLLPGLRNRLLRLAAFQNPEFYRAQAMRLSTFGKPRVITCAEDHLSHLGLPRGCLDDVLQALKHLGVRATLRDERCGGQPMVLVPDLRFHGELRPEQFLAAQALLAHDTGVLAATTAFGKTVVAAWLIAQRGVNTLVLVHRQQLLEQWIERLSTFLGLPTKVIGRIGGGRRRPSGQIDVALIQSLISKGVVNDCVAGYGQLIVDECHHLPAHSFEQVARRTKARFVVGLTATVERKNGHHPIIFMQCGPVRHRVHAKAQALTRPFEHRVFVQPTAFQSRRDADPDARVEFQSLYRELVADEQRNRRICDDVVQCVRDGRSPLVLTERSEHLDRLEQTLAASVSHLVVLRAGLGKKQQQALAQRLAAIPCDEARVLLATGRYIGEGFDDARLDTLMLTLPVSWRGTIAQYAGRLHRLCEGKREVRIYDYADLDVPMLARMFDRRCREYEALGYTIVLPANAVPGWPQDVPLPADPAWKRDYAGSVRRLTSDGVDAPLASLFVHTVRPPAPDAEGADRARSATEAFLYRRLQTLPQTRDRFRLNAVLPIAFDGLGQMEVDLLCDDGPNTRIAVELDGDQHLADPVAYRRDRRKDLLLQESGYLVLRFLAQDVVRDLDRVLDTILRALVRRPGVLSKSSLSRD